MKTMPRIIILAALLAAFSASCDKKRPLDFFEIVPDLRHHNQLPLVHLMAREVKMKNYFDFMDSLVCHYDSLLDRPVSEHLIVRNNPWIIDTLAATDYYRLKERGITNLDQEELVIFRRGHYLIIPESAAIDSLNERFEQTLIDINIPEYTLRILENGQVVHECLVRVGRNERKYLAMAGGVVDLRTRTGSGTIIRHSKDPAFINPSNNHYYHVTRRDDGVVTAMPRIPWLEPEINGVRYGQLIHPTTNFETLGRAYSNGCIGTSEADAWRIYYHAPLGTRIRIRYELEVVDQQGDTVRLEDIYRRSVR